jgi:hypothetical protein
VSIHRNVLKVVIVVAALLLLKSCLFPSTTYRALKITAQVDTPKGLRTGSSVIAFVTKPIPKWLPGSIGSSSQVIGESPVVDLGAGKRLFVLLNDEHFAHDVRELLDARQRNADNSVKSDSSPTLVTFADPSDALSIIKVPPNSLAAVFGSGYSLRRILAEPVDEAANFGVLEKIPLFRDNILKLPLERMIGKEATGGPVPESDPRRLTRMSFQQSAPR